MEFGYCICLLSCNFCGWWSRHSLVPHPGGVVLALGDQCQNQFPPRAPGGPWGVGCCRTGLCSTLLRCASRPPPERGCGDTECADISVLFGTVVSVYVSLSAKTDELLKKEKDN